VDRRRFILLGLGSSVLLLGAGGALQFLGRYPAPPFPLRVLNAKEFAVLRAASSRIAVGVERASPDEIARFIDGYLEKLPLPARRDVKSLLQFLEHAKPLHRFTRLAGPEQDEVLASWQSSGLELKRRGLQGLKSIVYMGAYRDPRSWKALGYTGPSR
jgi:hypothetical protein